MGKENKADSNKNRLNWHPAFFQAIQQELSDYLDSLEFKYEFQLTTEPLRIDLLVIKKPKELTVNKNIARIFRTDNILEYKSPEDHFSVKDFLKVYAYANLYAAITKDVELSDVTITFVSGRYPRNLIKYLVETRGYKAEETAPGIYRVSGDYIPIQIIETKKLPESENLWLKGLTNDLEIRSLDAILKERHKKAQEVFPEAYFDVIIRANPEVFLEVLNMANGAMTFEEVFTKAGIIPKWIERGREKTAQNLLSIGMPIEEIAQVTELPIEKVRALGNNKK